jgi:hypothetical protein
MRLFWWSINLFCSTRTECDYETQVIHDQLEKLKKHVYTGVNIPSKMIQCDGNTYYYGRNSTSTYTTNDPPEILLHPPTDATSTCVNYTQEKINDALSECNEVSFGLSQVSHVDSSSEEELSSCFGISDDDFNFEDRQNTFKEYHEDSNGKPDSAYGVLEGDFATLCKYIDGNQELINEWKLKFTEGKCLATSLLNVTSDSSSKSGEYVLCYKGLGSIKKQKRKQLATKDYA